jgi:hypothetical protein
MNSLIFAQLFNICTSQNAEEHKECIDEYPNCYIYQDDKSQVKHVESNGICVQKIYTLIETMTEHNVLTLLGELKQIFDTTNIHLNNDTIINKLSIKISEIIEGCVINLVSSNLMETHARLSGIKEILDTDSMMSIKKTIADLLEKYGTLNIKNNIMIILLSNKIKDPQYDNIFLILLQLFPNLVTYNALYNIVCQNFLDLNHPSYNSPYSVWLRAGLLKLWIDTVDKIDYKIDDIVKQIILNKNKWYSHKNKHNIQSIKLIADKNDLLKEELDLFITKEKKLSGSCKHYRNKLQCSNPNCGFYHGPEENLYGIQKCKHSSCFAVNKGECFYYHKEIIPEKFKNLKQILKLVTCTHDKKIIFEIKHNDTIKNAIVSNYLFFCKEIESDDQYCYYMLPKCSLASCDNYPILIFYNVNSCDNNCTHYCCYEHAKLNLENDNNVKHCKMTSNYNNNLNNIKMIVKHKNYAKIITDTLEKIMQKR